MPKILDSARELIRTLHYSIRTEEAYLLWIKKYILFHRKRHPLEMGGPEVAAFLTHLAVDRDLAAASQNQALCALLSLDRNVLGRPLGEVGPVMRAKRPARLPTVFAREEVRAVLAQLDGDKW